MRSAQDALAALRAAQPDAANGSRDFGRGYAHAVATLEAFLAADDDGPAVYVNDEGTEMVTVSEDAATVAQRVSRMDRWLPPHRHYRRTR
jgi:hypothetical protein